MCEKMELMEPKERITNDPAWPDAWTCVCGNTSLSDGFDYCDAAGNEIEPTIRSGWDGFYLCASCGRIIDQTTLEVVGRSRVAKVF